MVTQSTKLRELKEEVAVKAKWLHDVFDEAGPDRDFSKIKSLEGDTQSKIDKIRAANAELSEMNASIKNLEELEAIAVQAQAQWSAGNQIVNPPTFPDGQHVVPQAKSLGRLLVESESYKKYHNARSTNWEPIDIPDFDPRNAFARRFYNTVFQTGGGWDSQDIRIPRVELNPQRPIAVVDMIPMLPTSEAAVVFMEETTFTNNATETAESTATTASDLIGEAALALTQRTKPVEWLPVFIPVTMQQLEDVEAAEAYVNQRLEYMLRARLDLQILGGDGSTPNLEGTENVSGIQTQALSTDSIPDAIYKLFTSIRDDGFAEPSVAFIRPDKWQEVRLLKTADGAYIWGHPSEPGPMMIWGVPVVQTTAVTATKCIAGDYTNFSALYTKRGVTLAVSDSHSSYFTRGMLAIKADMRVSMVHFRPKAFGEVTGL